MRLTFGSLLLAPALLLSATSRAQNSDITRLDRVTVLAGQFPTGDQPGTVLSALDVVRTPGTASDINRALQTLPGVQLVDEGNALFVRGGDSIETPTLINGIRYPNATRLNSPAGSFTGTINPFEARKIDFSSGGFSARYGNALSGVVDIDTIGAPAVNGITLGAGLGAVTIAADAALNDFAGARLMGTRSSVAPITRLNGANRDYPEPPNGHDLAAAGSWEYRPGGELRLFGVEQVLHLRLNVQLPTARGVFYQAVTNRLGTANWADTFGAWTIHVDAGGGSLARNESIDGSAFATQLEHRQLAARAGYGFSDAVQFSFGVEGTQEHNTLTKYVAPTGSSPGGAFSTAVPDTRQGAFAETDTMLAPHLRAIVGLRTDRSSLTHQTTVDPRLSFAWEPRHAMTFSVAGGEYHQVPPAYDFVGSTGRLAQPAMRVNELLGAVQLGKDEKLVRIEAYSKQYRQLVGLTREYLPIGGGAGRSQGIDLFLKAPLPLAMRSRVTYSYAEAQRTDPDSGRIAVAPFDVRHTATLLVERAFGSWVASAAWRYASGRPVTPIVGGTPDGQGGFTPVYGTPFSERLPALGRLDLSASRYYRLNPHTGLVLYVALSNVLNRRNVYTYEYSPDFTARRPTPSIFNRSAYFGFSLQFNG